jgi:hypothetical protein
MSRLGATKVRCSAGNFRRQNISEESFMRFQALRLAFLAAVTTSALAVGCGPAVDGGEGEGEGDGSCGSGRDCGAGEICDKTNDGDDLAGANDPEGICVKVVCFTDADCNNPEEEKCDARRGFCVPRNLCDPGDENACPNAGERCVYTGGLPRCVAPPAATACALTPSEGYVAVDGALQIEGVGTDAAGKLVPHTTFTFSGTDVSASGLVSPTSAGDITVTATTTNGGVTCTATVHAYAAVGDNDLRVVVIDQASRTPLAGVPVAAKVGGATVEGETGTDGSFTFVGGTGAEAVSVFPENHQWHTILNPGDDIVLYTAAIETEPRVDGIKGAFDFSRVHSKGEIRLGLAGTAINAAITDLNFDAIIGEFVDTRIEIEGITEDGGQQVSLPEGLVIGLGEESFKGEYVALSTNDGPSVAWALGGQVALSKVAPIVTSVTGAGDELNVGAILSAILPFFAKFDHAIATGLEFSPAARTDGDPNFEDVTLTPDTLLMLEAGYDLPGLPCAPKGYTGGANRCGNPVFQLVDGDTTTLVNECPASLPTGATCDEVSSYTSGTVVLSGVVVPGQGLVPLGISAALDDADGDRTPEFDGVAAQAGEGAPGDGKLRLDYAPPHDGVEGNLYVTVAIALDINSISGSSDLGASIITQVSRSLPTSGNDFAGNTFLESQGGSFSPATGAFTMTKIGDADFYRVNLDNGAESEWNVWFDGTNPGSFTVGSLPVAAGVAASARATHADVQAFALGTGYEGAAPTTFDELMAFDGQDIDNLLLYLGGWSSESCRTGGLCEEQ